MTRRLTSLVLALLLATLVAVPASGATAYKTKASANSRGAAFVMTESMLQTVVNDPYAIRVGFRTANDKANTITYSYSVICENGVKERFDRTIKSAADNTWVNVTVYGGSTSLGRFCDVFLHAELNNRARLYTRIQAKHP
jgi:hypothetical protein